MKNCRHRIGMIVLVAVIFPAMLASYPADAGLSAAYLYNLSDFKGIIRNQASGLHVNEKYREVYVMHGDIVRVYNDTGMLVHQFGDDPELGTIYDLAVDESGDIYTLSYPSHRSGPGVFRFFITRCNFRGEPKEKLDVSGLPPEFSDLGPTRIFLREGRFFLASLGQMRCVVVDKKGVFERGYDFARMIDQEKEKEDKEFFGFAMDDKENFYFTVPVLFKVFKVSPEGKVASFGRAGGSPGRFGIVSGIGVDKDGNVYVSDKLKDVVMVFDKSFRYLGEFGYRSGKAGSLVKPYELALGSNGLLYVTQLQKRGVSVFSVTPTSDR